MPNGSKTWQCTNCKAGCKTQMVDGSLTADVYRAHNPTCFPQPERIHAAKVKKEMKELAKQQPTASVNSLAADALGSVGADDMPFVPSNEKLKRAAWNARASERKKRRDNGIGQDACYDSMETLTWPDPLEVQGEAFIMHDTGPGPNRIVLFGTQKTLHMLARSDVWLADGTFKSAPALFAQLYTVHGSLQGFILPGIYALLPNKSKKTYKQLWTIIKTLIGADDTWEAPTLLVDFEKAAYDAALEVFGDMELGGCFSTSSRQSIVTSKSLACKAST